LKPGIPSFHERFTAMASSGISRRNAPRQYHWSPGPYSPSKAPLSAAIGIRCTPWSSGSATESIGAIAFSASSSDASMHQTTPHTLRRWSSSGKASFTGGIVWKLKNPITLRGADGSHSR
jgi:hypothetical protein